MNLKKIFVIVLFLSGAALASSDFNAKSIESITAKITQSGSLIITGSMESANLSIFIPQEGVQSIDVTGADRWGYFYDEFNNKKILLEWIRPTGTVNYKIETNVKNNAKHLPAGNYKIGNNQQYLKETDTIVITDKIREIAYPYEKTLEGIAEMAKFVYDYVDYDISFAGQRKSSDWVLQNRKGVCVEHANLFTAMLRAKGIPTRYVVGYAYSQNDKAMIGHTWVEVLVLDDKNNEIWVSFDPTWLQGGYIDATHIKTAVLLDDSQSELLAYRGAPGSNIEWKREGINELQFDKTEILSYESKNITEISVNGSSEIAANNFGFIKATIKANGECTIASLRASSCVDSSSNKVIEVFDEERNVWLCNEKDIYWIYRPLGEKNNYVCPLIVYDQIGTKMQFETEVSGTKEVSDVFISGPSSAAINEEFEIVATAENEFAFFSPNFGESKEKTWKLSISRPGKYTFYLYSGNSMSTKEVSIVEKKEFLVNAEVPKNITLGGSFIVKAGVQNIFGQRKNAKVSLIMDETNLEKEVTLDKEEIKYVEFNITTTKTGNRKITVSAAGDALYSYSGSIYVYEEKKKSDFIGDLFGGIAKFFSDLFGGIGKLLGGK